jgi:hypothetical protein
MSLTIEYRLSGSGWAECTIRDGASSCDLTASYLSDALQRLVVAATAVISGFRCVSFSFDEEPGEYRWVIDTPRPNEIQLNILEFNELWGEKPDSEGVSLFKSKCLPVTFAKAVANTAQKVLDVYGEEGYQDRWSEHPFPKEQLRELVAIIKALEQPVP